MALNTELLITLQNVKGLGNKTILKLAQSVDLNSIEDLCEYWNTISTGRLGKITQEDLATANRAALRIIDASDREGIGIISYFEDNFPEILRGCVNEQGTPEPPIVLYYRGNLKALEKPGIAVIGTREPTPMGYKAGVYFSKELANNGFNIVSGLAIGCDTSGHRGALEANGTTTAFLATSLAWDEIYPQENLSLAHEIVKNGGLLLSEYALGQRCGRFTFVARDRLQAGLSYATLVVQIGKTSGTYHAMNATKMAGKPLYMIQFKNAEDLNDTHAQGNVIMLANGEAQPINTKLMPMIIQNLKDYVGRIEGKEHTRQSLFD